MFDFAGIKRSLEFSPNHRGNDNAIFTLTVDELKKLGCSVTLYSEDDLLLAESVEEQYIFTMSRSKPSVQKLQRLEKEGKTVINSAFAIENCFRANMTALLIENGIPYPKSFIVPTAKRSCQILEELGGKNFWIKRGDFHAIHKEDVSFAHTPSQANDILKEYSLRGIGEAVLSEHLYGDLVKFYGVRGTDFFHWFYPYEFNHSKYNAEVINGAANYYDFSIETLKSCGHHAAEALGVFIYGGDAIISRTGEIHIIDLNDWPSFAPCREEASYHIAQCIYKKASVHSNISATL
ncbi:MAG: hypothetical protein JWR72_214 [Flavisolibacter sp.]|jgi:hypothetical protein|nr:hypothetical protein [Flavisolibacter sp.]